MNNCYASGCERGRHRCEVEKPMNPLQSLRTEVRRKIEFVVGLDEQRDFLDSIIDRTVALVESMIPQEKPDNSGTSIMVLERIEAFNDCRAQMIKNLQTLRETKDEV